jgi:Tfp pilus assembly protein PilV
MPKPITVRDDPRSEAGFSLLEVLICVALLVAGGLIALSVVPTLAHESQHDLLRDAATNIGRTEIERAQAATAYYPTGGYVANHSYALNPMATYIAMAHVHRGYCTGAAATTDVPMTVTDAYASATDTVTVTVSYPRNPCDPTVQDTVALSAVLAPSALVPGTAMSAAIDDPAQQ